VHPELLRRLRGRVLRLGSCDCVHRLLLGPKPILLQAHELPEGVPEPEPQPLSIDDWLATLGAEVLKEELDALGAETCEDLERLDDEDMELLVTAATAKLKKLKAKKFIRALGASSAAPKRRNSGKHIGAESHNMAR